MTAKAQTAGAKLDDALKKADDAVKELKSMGENAKVAITEDYSSLKEALADTNVAHKLVEAKDRMVQVTNASVDKVKECGARMDENVHAKPYHYIAGAAVAGLVLGILIGRKG